MRRLATKRKEVLTIEQEYLRLLVSIVEEQIANLKKPGKTISLREFKKLHDEHALLTGLIRSANVELDAIAYRQIPVSRPTRRRAHLRLIIGGKQ